MGKRRRKERISSRSSFYMLVRLINDVRSTAMKSKVPNDSTPHI